jgi:uncharacterized protein
MLKVIADTSCIQYLYQINRLQLLPTLYERIIVPEAVAIELAKGKGINVRLPDILTIEWIAITPVSSVQEISKSKLGIGEREVIALALNIPNSLAILDDNLARLYAKQLNIPTTGTLGILLKAKQLEHISALSPLLDDLDNLGFRLDRITRQSVLKLAGES